MITLSILNGETILDYLGGAMVLPRVFIRRRQGAQNESAIGRCYPASFEDGGRGHEPRNVGGL